MKAPKISTYDCKTKGLFDEPSAKKRNFAIKLKWKLFAFLVVFMLFAIFVVWLFQVGMLNSFYRRERHNDIEKAASQIISAMSDDRENLNDIALDCAANYDVCLRIFEIIDNNASEIASVEGTGSCFIHFMGTDDLSKMLHKANENGGVFVELLDFSHFDRDGRDSVKTPQPSSSNDSDSNVLPEIDQHKGEVDGDSIEKSEYDDINTQNDGIVKTDIKILSEIYVKIFNASDGGKYAVMLNANLVPVSTIVNTLSMQFIWIVAILTVGALVLAVLLSKMIAKPVSDMNTAAKQLSLGKYDVQFPEKGCKETRELAKTLNHAAVELSKNDELQKELIANISHDLRTPLTMICGYSEVIRDIPQENTPENMQVIIDEAKRMSDLVQDILDISKIQSGAREPSFEILDLTETINTILKRYHKLVEHEGYDISFYNEENVTVKADQKMISQVIYNLVNNAVNYCGEDKVINISQTVNQGGVRITVSDNGMGIEPENIPYIWDRYYKIDRVHKRSAVGSGLGLSIVKEILELHDATYGVYSTPGVGSAFWFELSISEEYN